MRKFNDLHHLLFSAACLSHWIPRIAMPSTKPLDIVILSKDQDGSAEDLWKPYQEYGEKTTTAKGWSCYILAKEGEVSVIGAIFRLRTHTSDSAVFDSMQEYDGEAPRGPDLR